MPVPKIQQRPNGLPAQKRSPKNQNTKKVVRTNPVKNAKVTTAGAVAHMGLAGAVLQQLRYTYQPQSN
ncbi:hypothetical protein [Chryseobacterium potabilaquae]|uniref:Uncharacterized protein n=1 Tax=Chryseobacterium potabilaquae TaxID=2675057 RepID=A0A6N4X412_9FLAO|nr:hypothetical protein [Chryseobacterium potabilaquae]CAA7193959.1 hypothetical protein CHRY9293_00338 [Chryseobacterium potabilaquae]